MSIQNPTGKTLIGVLSAILIGLGGYSAETMTSLVNSNHELLARVARIESKIELFETELGRGERFTWQNGVNLAERIERLELRVDGVVHQFNK